MQTASKKKSVSVKDKLDGNEIDLSLLELTEVPVKQLAQVTRGTVLDLSNNKLVTLPDTFPTLTHLVKLDLSKNQLKELPVDFGDLRNLKQLDLYSNQLQRLPVSFHKLKELRWLDLKNNPLVATLAEAAGDCLDQKGCQEAARKVVKLMTVVQAELEKKRLKDQEELKAKQLAQKLEEDQAREQSRMEKKAEKERKRNEAANRQHQASLNSKSLNSNNIARDEVKSGKATQHRQSTKRTTTVQQGPSFCVKLFVLLFRLVFVVALLSAGIFAVNWDGPLTLANAGVVARRSVDQVSRFSRQAYDWAAPHLEPVREQWKHLSRFVADNGRDLVFIVWDKTAQYARTVQQQALIIWPIVQQRCADASSTAVYYWRIACKEAPVYYNALVDRVSQLYTGKEA